MFFDILLTSLSIAQSLVWVDFVVKTFTYVTPAQYPPPLLAFIVALCTTATSVLITLLVCYVEQCAVYLHMRAVKSIDIPLGHVISKVQSFPTSLPRS
jgi:hypothetical protein